MPPKAKLKEKDILNGALEEVREKGFGRLNARDLAKLLSCSTSPIFSCFGNMEGLKEAVVKRGNKGAVSDGLIAAMLARTAVVGALFNVKINLASIKDESYVSELEKRVEKLESDAIFCEKSILCLSKLSDTVYNR